MHVSGRLFGAANIRPPASCPRLSRASTSFLRASMEKGVDGRTSPAMTPKEGSRQSLMKTILVPVEDHDSMAAVLQAAGLAARRFDSYVEGFAVQPAASEFVALDPLSSLTMPQVADGDAQIERHSRQMFESFMASRNVPPTPPRFPTLPPYPPPQAGQGRGGGAGRRGGASPRVRAATRRRLPWSATACGQLPPPSRRPDARPAKRSSIMRGCGAAVSS